MSIDFDGNLTSAIIGAFVGGLGTWWTTHQQIKIAKRDASRNYLEVIVLALTGMAKEFENNLIPYQDGHTLGVLIDVFKPKLDGYVNIVDVEVEYEKLKELLAKAKRQDQILATQLSPPNATDLKNLIANLRRITGDLIGLKEKI